MTNPFHKSRETTSAEFRPRGAERLLGLTMMYGDTLPDGGHMAPKLQFGNQDTVLAVSRVMDRLGNRPLIAKELGKMAQGEPSGFDPDPDDQARNPLMLHGEPARQVQGVLEDLADDMYPGIDGGAVQLAQHLVAQSFRRLEVPHDLSDEQLTFYAPQASYYEQETRASLERQLSAN